jgi:uncharacterized protein (TIGR01732 family)
MFRKEKIPPVMGANVSPPPQAVMGANVPPPQPQAVMGMGVAPQPYCFPVFAYAAPVNRCNDFVLIVVLFILLIIVGAYYCFC